MAELNNTSTGKWYEVDASNTSPSPDGWPSGTYPNQVEPIGRSTMGAIKRFWDRINGTVTSGGSSNAYTYTPVNVSYPTSYVQGEEYTFLANFTNTGAATLNINSLGAKNLYKKTTSGVTALVGGEIQSGDLVKVQYDGTQLQIMSSMGSTLDDGSVTTAKLATNAVTTVKITDANVTTAKIANASVTLAKIANASTNSVLLGSGASGSGAPYAELSLGTNLSMSGTTLNASGSLTLGTLANSTSGTSIDFTGIPSTAKQVIISFNGVSTNGTSIVQIQIGSGSFVTTGYSGAGALGLTGQFPVMANNSSGFLTAGDSTATYVRYGSISLINMTGNTWTASGTMGHSDSARTSWFGGTLSLSGALDRVRITTVNGTDTFDAGTINIAYQ